MDCNVKLAHEKILLSVLDLFNQNLNKKTFFLLVGIINVIQNSLQSSV